MREEEEERDRIQLYVQNTYAKRMRKTLADE